MDLALNNLQRLIGHKNQPTNQPTIKMIIFFDYCCQSSYSYSTFWMNVDNDYHMIYDTDMLKTQPNTVRS